MLYLIKRSYIMNELNKLREELNQIQQKRSDLQNKYQDTLHIIYPEELKENDILLFEKEQEITKLENSFYL